MVNDFDGLVGRRMPACRLPVGQTGRTADRPRPYMRNNLLSSPLTRRRNKSPLSLTFEHTLLNLFWIAPNFQ